MRPDSRFTSLPKTFWANVRAISEAAGYTERGIGTVKVYDIESMRAAMRKVGLGVSHLDRNRLGARLHAYFEYRAHVLNDVVQHQLMNVDQARVLFEQYRARLNPKCPIPMNKQRGEKKGPNYLTGLVNMMVEAHIQGLPVDYDPRTLTSFTYDDAPLRTLARRVDGAFPSTVNPIALWEIKEYYFTTTFGSRIADSVYESLLDGMELEELREHEGIEAQHLLIVDAHYTWWRCGRSYLCRLIDMLHMGYVDEILFGREVVERMPEIVGEWVRLYEERRIT